MFRHTFINSYLKRNQVWPPFQYEPEEGTRLRRHWRNQVTELPFGSYDLSDLDNLKFGQIIDFDYSVDYMQFMDDKAISVGATYLPTFWFTAEQCGLPKPPPRRLLTQLLELTEVNIREMTDRHMNGYFSEDELVVEMSQKEREFKMAARCFAKMTFEVRLFWVLLEHNLKRLGEMYFPQQTMTMAEAEEKKRLYDLVKTHNKPNMCFLEVDFTAWNNYWEVNTTDPIGLDLGDLFGKPKAFIWIHRFFKEATQVVTDKNMIPPGADPKKPLSQWPESDLLWRGRHRGGFEGIQQFYWTWCTMTMMYTVLYDQNVSFRMAGQGDNQVFTLFFDLVPDDTLQDALIRLLYKMEIRCYFMNHRVKPEECIDSSTVLTYGKELYVRGVHIPYNLKFASRSFHLEDREAPSLTRDIAGIMSCANACADSSFGQRGAILWKHILLRLFFRGRLEMEDHRLEHVYLQSILTDRGFYQYVSLLPGSLGGLPILPWTRFFMKGEVDDLSWDVAAVMHTSRYSPNLYRDLTLLVRGSHSPRNPDPASLIDDPHSIPLKRTDDRSTLIKEAVGASIGSFTRNVNLKGIFAVEGMTRPIRATLAAAQPLYPDIMADLYEFTPPGLRESVLARFTMTRTLADMTGRGFSDQMRIANSNILRYMLDRYRSAMKLITVKYMWQSPFKFTGKLRDLWKVGLKNADIGVYTPFEFKLTYGGEGKPWISCSLAGKAKDVTSVLGTLPPMFGSKTKAKVSTHGYKIVNTGSAIRDLKGLVLTLSNLVMIQIWLTSVIS